MKPKNHGRLKRRFQIPYRILRAIVVILTEINNELLMINISAIFYVIGLIQILKNEILIKQNGFCKPVIS